MAEQVLINLELNKPKETAEAIIKLAPEFKNVNIFCSFIGGSRVREGVELLKSAKIDWGVMEDAIPEVLSCE